MSSHSTPTAFATVPHFHALEIVRTPGSTRWFARLFLILLIALPFALIFVPWQQTVRGRGQVVAFAPTERRQIVTARVSGQITKWHVYEGSMVKAGDPIADIDDNDPGLSERLELQKNFLHERRKAAEQEVTEQTRAIDAQVRALDASVRAAKANLSAAKLLVEVAQETEKNNEFAQGYEQTRYEMFQQLFMDKKFGGLQSRLDRDEAKMRADRAATDVKRAAAEIKRAEAVVVTNESLVAQAEATGLTSIATLTRDLHRAQQNIFSIDRELQEIETRIERFKARFVVAPCDGIIHEVLANAGVGGQSVKDGQELVEIVPDTKDRVVELMIDGVDAPLISAVMQETGRGPHVRLQFEGWPGVQFAGWPSVAVGTFGGRVRQMDPTDDGFGRFRILVEPEQMFEGDTWPEGFYLRQGNQAVGWVFLNRVTLGYELWRQLNGFPPVIAPKPPGDKAPKPPKVKPS